MLTVLFATRNRARLLREVLDGFCCLQAPPSGWKLVVVDNGSTDDTLSVLASFTDRLPLQFISHSTPGKNAALNAGLALVEGDLTVLTDDDVFPHSDWLIQLRKAADTQSEFSIFGGAIVPRWEVPPPHWLGWLDLGPIFTITPAWMKEGPLPSDQITLVQGPNMLVRTSVFHSGTRFDVSIGPRGFSYPMGSETEFVLRLGSQGHRGWYVKSAIVEHFVRKEQMEKSWIMQRAVRWGRGCHRIAPNVKSWRGMPLHLLRDFPKEAISIASAWITLRAEALFRARWRFNILCGKLIEARIMAREQRPQASCAPEVRREAQ
jgi:glycosyltransferase involved in cell wall biosynthesis